MTVDDWVALPESARTTLKWLADRFAEGFTGEIRLNCRDGGVSEVRPTPTLHPEDLEAEVLDRSRRRPVVSG